MHSWTFKFFLSICASVALVSCKPVPQNSAVNNKAPPTSALDFMKKYGYLEETSTDTEALYSEAGLKDVIRTVQKFGAISETGVIDNATIKLMASPRCGIPDVIRARSKRFIIGAKGWQKRSISYFIANWSQVLGLDVVRKQIKAALTTWGKYGRLNFREVNDSNADIIVAFASGSHGDLFPFDGPGSVLAHAYFPYEFDNFGGDIHFDNDEDWRATPDSEGFYFYTVALHELGHSLGLAHSPVPNSVMFPYYIGHRAEDVLEYDDILGMYELYIKQTLEEDKMPSTKEPYYEEPTSKGYGQEDDYYSSSTVSPTTEDFNFTVTYDGDFETVDDHRNHDGTNPSSTSSTIPNICKGNFDAVATLRDEMFIFKDKYLWRLKDKFKVEPGYPVPIKRMFPLPDRVRTIDAAYQRSDGMIVLFYGKEFWVYDGQQFVENSPKSVAYYGIPSYVESIDAAQVWAKNGKTYLYSADHFWRFNDTSRALDPGYPKHMERWRGVPENLDAATTWKDGLTYFFKGAHYWKFNNDWVIVSDSSPLPAPQIWLGCPEESSD